MTNDSVEALIAQLTQRIGEESAAELSAAAIKLAQTEKGKSTSTPAETEREAKLENVLERIAKLTVEAPSSEAACDRAASVSAKTKPGSGNGTSRATATKAKNTPAPAAEAPEYLPGEFYPKEPKSFQEARVSENEVEALILKYLLARGDAAGRDCADQVKLPFVLIEELMRQMKQDQWIVHRSSAPMNDYVFQLTDIGRERARRHTEHCTYFGAAPVHLKDYNESVEAQSITKQHPTPADLAHAFEDLMISPKMMARLGPAINSGRGLFLFGASGNGKTSIAERVTRSFGQTIWVPRAIGVDGEIIRLYDPGNHEEAPLESSGGLMHGVKIDKRWVRVRRPTIVVGGELTMENLEVTLNTATGINEAPMQLKSNCGTLVIDDFGRQRIRIDELLNRWIVPLEKRYDFLNLTSGKKLQVPFDQLIIFSTNLEPRDLVDDAFLRRIPYKIEVIDPTEVEFRDLFRLFCPRLGFAYQEAAINYAIETHYRKAQRPFRCCQPRDLLLQIRNYCLYHKKPLELTNEYFDFAVENYFAIV
jgi:hypothetical protein